MRHCGMPKEFWMLYKAPTATSILERRFLSSEALEFEDYGPVIGFGGGISMEKALQLTVEVFG